MDGLEFACDDGSSSGVTDPSDGPSPLAANGNNRGKEGLPLARWNAGGFPPQFWAHRRPPCAAVSRQPLCICTAAASVRALLAAPLRGQNFFWHHPWEKSRGPLVRAPTYSSCCKHPRLLSLPSSSSLYPTCAEARPRLAPLPPCSNYPASPSLLCRVEDPCHWRISCSTILPNSTPIPIYPERAFRNLVRYRLDSAILYSPQQHHKPCDLLEQLSRPTESPRRITARRVSLFSPKQCWGSAEATPLGWGLVSPTEYLPDFATWQLPAHTGRVLGVQITWLWNAWAPLT